MKSSTVVLCMKLLSSAIALILLNTSAIAQNCQPELDSYKPTFSFTDNGASVVDASTNLEWQKCALGQVYSTGSGCEGIPFELTWKQAFIKAGQFSENPILAGGSQWRLPNVKELSTLIDSACYNPASNQGVLPGLGSFHYWTATNNFQGGGGDAWAVDFTLGSINRFNKTATYRVILVKEL